MVNLLTSERIYYDKEFYKHQLMAIYLYAIKRELTFKLIKLITPLPRKTITLIIVLSFYNCRVMTIVVA